MLSFLAILLCAVTLTAQQSPSEESVRSAADAKEQLRADSQIFLPRDARPGFSLWGRMPHDSARPFS